MNALRSSVVESVISGAISIVVPPFAAALAAALFTIRGQTAREILH